jgi:hypothetical protein
LNIRLIEAALTVPEFGVDASRVQKLVVRATLRNLTSCKYDDPVAVVYGT